MTTTIDVARLRAETPGCSRVIHLNNAAASLMPQPVLSTVTEYLQQEALEGPMEVVERSREPLDQFYHDAARMLGCEPDEVAITGSSSQAWHLAFASIPFQEGDRILTGRAEWAGNLANMYRAVRQRGVKVEIIPVDDRGRVSVEALQRMVDGRVRVIALPYLPANGGLINPAAEVGRIARAAGAFYLLDASQAVGQMPVDVRELGCDVLCASGRKYLRGPRGTGVLYARRSFLAQTMPPVMDVHSAPWAKDTPYQPRADARRYESGESAVALRLGLARAVRYALDLGIENIWARIQQLAGDLRERLSQLQGVSLHDLGEQRSGLVAMTVEGVEPKEVRQRLQSHRINVAVNGLSYTPLDMAARGLEDIVRLSVHYYNTTEELDQVCDVLRSLRTR